MTARSNHTIGKLYKEGTIHRILCVESYLILFDSLEVLVDSEDAEKTLCALVLQTTVIGADEIAVPEPILKRIADQIGGRADARTGPVSESDQAALAVCRCVHRTTMSGPQVAREKVRYIRRLVTPLNGGANADEA